MDTAVRRRRIASALAVGGTVVIAVAAAVACSGGLPDGTVAGETAAVDEVTGTAARTLESSDAPSPVTSAAIGENAPAETPPVHDSTRVSVATDDEMHENRTGDRAVATAGGATAGQASGPASVETEHSGPPDPDPGGIGDGAPVDGSAPVPPITASTEPTSAGVAGHPPVDTGEEAGAGEQAELATAAEDTGSETAESGFAVDVSEDVPDFAMLDIATGSTVSLRSVVTGRTPLLFWFWSPL